MLNKIIQYSLHNRLLVMIAAVALLVWGSITAHNMEVDVFPDLNAPTVVVMTEAQGMAPEEVERLVTFPVETAVNGATDVRRVRSSSTTGFSVVWVEFEWGTNIYTARQIVSEKLATLGEALPSNVGQPTLGPQSSILGEIMIIGLTADTTSLQDLRTIADWTIRPRLLSTGGVAQVAVIGGDIKEYQILLDPARMKHYGISLEEVLPVLENMNQNATGGILYEYGNEYIVQGVMATTHTDELGKAVIKTIGDVPVVISDIAEVSIGAKTPKLGLASEKGKPAVLVTVTKQPSTNTLELTDKLDASVAELQKTLPEDVKISTDIFRQSRFINSSIDNIQKALFEGSIFVIVVLFFFLMNFRTTIISLVALPLSLLMAILVMHALGLTINTMSLGGLAIAIGSLVDDAIVDVENVYKRLRENRLKPAEKRRPTIEIVFEGSKEVRMPILNSTLIIVACFLPLFFLSGMEGRMLIPLGIAFIVALFASTIVALTLTPVLCSYMLTSEKALRKSEKEPIVSRSLKKIYRHSLDWALRHKKVVIGSSLALLVVSILLLFNLGRSFLPPFNEGSLTINISTMPGISLEESNKMGQMTEEILLGIPEIKTVARKTGRAELDEHALGVNVSEIEAPFELDERSRDEFLADVRQQLGVLKGVNVEIGQPISHRIDAMLSGTKANIAIKLFGNDLNKLYSLGSEIKGTIQDVQGIADLTLEQQVERPQLQIKPKRDMLAKYGITLPQFSEFINVALSGQTVSQVNENGKIFDLTVKIDDRKRGTMEEIGELTIDANGRKIPLHYVAEILPLVGPNTISRENVQRKIVVSANVAGRDLKGVVNDIRKTIDEQITLPEGYHVEYGGQFESEAAASRTLFLTSMISILIIFLILFHEFRSLSLSGIIMLNLPLAIIGGVISIWFTSGVISIPSIIGFISLFGIATRNGILLVSHYNWLRAEGYSLRESILQGSLDRLNPILMTALSSALALIPLAMGGDLPGNEIQSPMAQVILGGLLSSTLLNGFVVPIVYYLLNRKKAATQPVTAVTSSN
ncbi:MAG: efflux RND transporter permease subunit [Odoribacter splanchnicus]|nr:efflux RND transporter permease subunit [Odoribacter splanchnicus]